jgi:hypothetical protein
MIMASNSQWDRLLLGHIQTIPVLETFYTLSLPEQCLIDFAQKLTGSPDRDQAQFWHH